MYKKIFYSNAKDINENNIKVEIYKNTDDVVVEKELLLANDGIQIKYDNSNNIFKTLIQSTCSITFLTSDIQYDLYTSTKNDVVCKIYKNDKLFYFGILTNNIYNSEYQTDLDAVTVEFIDVIASLENYKYHKSDRIILSFYDVLNTILNEVDTQKVISNIYIQQLYKYKDTYDLLNKLCIQEKNLFDEKGEGLDYKDILSNMIQYLNLSLIQFEDSIYIYSPVDLSDSVTFVKYNRNDTTTTNVTLNSQLKTFDVYSSNASISLQDTYNTINVIANTLSDDNTLPELIDADKWVNQNADPNKYYEYDVDDSIYLSAYFKQDVWNVYQPTVLDNLVETEIDEITNENIENLFAASFFQKNDSYKKEDGEPAALNWTDIFTIAATSKDNLIKGNDFKVLDTTVDYVIFKGGYFIFNMNYMFSNYHNANNTIIDSDVLYSNTKFSDGFDNTKFYCKLQIGDFFWNGDEWLSWTNDYLPHKDLYDNSDLGTEYVDGVTKYFYRYKLGDKVYISEEEFNKMMAKDRFILMHINKENDPIFNSYKQLTNQVSYKMNIANSTEGVLIPLPSSTIYGNMIFELYAPYELGRYANYRTDGSAGDNNTYVRYCHIKEMKMIYTNNNMYYDIFSSKEYEDDIKYSNIIDDTFVKQLDDIVFKINTYSEKAASYSYVLYNNNSVYDFASEFTKGNVNYIPEEFTIDKYCNYYSKPKLIYNNNVYINFNILDRFRIADNIFIVNSMTINLLNDNAEIVAMQI